MNIAPVDIIITQITTIMFIQIASWKIKCFAVFFFKAVQYIAEVASLSPSLFKLKIAALVYQSKLFWFTLGS